MKTQATTHEAEAGGNARRSALFLSLALGAALAAMVALAGTARQAEATFPGTNARIAFASERTIGVDNPTGDSEIFTVKPDGTGLKQLTFNTVEDNEPVFSPDGTKVAYTSEEGDFEVYLMNASDGSGQVNLTNNFVDDFVPVFSSDGQKIAYSSRGAQTSNPEGDFEVYLMNAQNGSGQVNLTNNGLGVSDFSANLSPDGQKIAYESEGKQDSNLDGDREVYVMSALDGMAKKNLSNNGLGVFDTDPVFSPGGHKIAYRSLGKQTSNPQGDSEVYSMNALDGSGKKNLSNNGIDIIDEVPTFSPDGTKIAYDSQGTQTSNPQGDSEIYRMNTLDGSGKKNLSNNDAFDESPDWGRQAM